MPFRDESGEEMLTAKEAAKELGLSVDTVRTQVKRGRLRAVVVTNRLNLIRRSDIEAYRKDRLGKPPGRKPRGDGS